MAVGIMNGQKYWHSDIEQERQGTAKHLVSISGTSRTILGHPEDWSLKITSVRERPCCHSTLYHLWGPWEISRRQKMPMSDISLFSMVIKKSHPNFPRFKH